MGITDGQTWLMAIPFLWLATVGGRYDQELEGDIGEMNRSLHLVTRAAGSQWRNRPPLCE